PSKVVGHTCHDDSTSNLVHHVAACPASQNTPEADAMRKYTQGTTYTPDKQRVYTTYWVSRARRPYTIIEDPELRTMFSSLYSRYQLQSRVTLSSDVVEIHGMAKSHIQGIIRALPGKIHVGADGWTSPNVL
ncbi:hypothetical protein DFP72DRAFT_766952, partial [Ephemerocybe angulata]